MQACKASWRFLLCLVLWQGAVAAPDSPFPLRVSGSRLLDAQGADFRIVGDAPWTLLVALTVPEADEYLAARQAAGFNTILVELVEPFFSGPRNRNGDAPFVDGDFSRPVDAYFRHVTTVLDLAEKRGFLVLLAPAYIGWQCGEQGLCQRLLKTPEPVLEGYGRYVGTLLARYPNLVWVHGGDADANRYGALARVEAVYRGINAVAPGGLHTAHCSRNFSAVDCYDRPWLNLNSTYSECEQTPARVLKDRERKPVLPSVYIEGRYEEEKATDLCLRSQLWWSYLGGPVGHVFGNKRIWRFEKDWRAALDTPGTRAMTVASRLLARLRKAEQQVTAAALADTPLTLHRWSTGWSRLREPAYPLGLAWSEVLDSDAEIPVARSATVTIAYLPYLTRFGYGHPGDTLCWVDPRTGAIAPAAVIAGEIRSPDAADWLFVAEKTAGICAGTVL